jgi:hypothetical protein
MANGNPRFEIDELCELEWFFTPVGHILEKFAIQHHEGHRLDSNLTVRTMSGMP